MPIVTTSNRGQIVIPKEIRKRLNIIPGKKLVVKSEGDYMRITPLPDNPVDSFCGIFKEKSSLTKSLLAEKKKEKAREEKKAAG
ncbi:MAG: AbrB/MazE/SpoVT family DNA-binding domain-containing protein [Desulfosudaceae bacterium]